MQAPYDSISILLYKIIFLQVLHPGIRRQVQIDLLLMKAGSVLISCLPGLKWLSLPEVVDEFEKLMTKQVVLTCTIYSWKLLPSSFIVICNPALVADRPSFWSKQHREVQEQLQGLGICQVSDSAKTFCHKDRPGWNVWGQKIPCDVCRSVCVITCLCFFFDGSVWCVLFY